MKLARVIGTVVATQKVDSLTGVKLLIVQPLDENQKKKGEPQIAVDATYQAGPGELVLIEGGREAAMALEETFNPADQAVMGIVDHVYTVTD